MKMYNLKVDRSPFIRENLTGFNSSSFIKIKLFGAFRAEIRFISIKLGLFSKNFLPKEEISRFIYSQSFSVSFKFSFGKFYSKVRVIQFFFTDRIFRWMLSFLVDNKIRVELFGIFQIKIQKRMDLYSNDDELNYGLFYGT